MQRTTSPARHSLGGAPGGFLVAPRISHARAPGSMKGITPQRFVELHIFTGGFPGAALPADQFVENVNPADWQSALADASWLSCAASACGGVGRFRRSSRETPPPRPANPAPGVPEALGKGVPFAPMNGAPLGRAPGVRFALGTRCPGKRRPVAAREPGAAATSPKPAHPPLSAQRSRAACCSPAARPAGHQP